MMRIPVIHACLGLLVLASCAARPRASIGYSVRALTDAKASAVLASARVVVELEGFEIDRLDPELGELVTRRKLVPETADDPGERGRVVRIRVRELEGVLTAQCSVMVQELATEAYRLNAQDAGGSDAPLMTAIDRGAGTTSAQNAVWRTIRRDRALELRILDAL